VVLKSQRQFPKDADDWKWFNKKVVDKVKQYHDQGFKVVIFRWPSVPEITRLPDCVPFCLRRAYFLFASRFLLDIGLLSRVLFLE
jgi:Polynucleotide kinase 3 phosphatase